MGIFVNPGNVAFQVALNSEIYVDKTGLLNYTNRVMDTTSKFICNSRPRRFGKSITADMLTAYYGRGCDSKAMFSDLEIGKSVEFQRHLNQYDVIHLDIQWCMEPAGSPENIVSYISEKTIAEGKRFVSRYYRNRRLGEFLKELDLSEGHSSGIPTIQEELEKNGSPRAEFFTDDDRRAMRIRIPIHPAFLKENSGDSVANGYEKATNKLSKKKKEQYDKILKLMADDNWHKTAEIAEHLGLKDTRTKELLKELVVGEKLINNGKTKGKMYKIK